MTTGTGDSGDVPVSAGTRDTSASPGGVRLYVAAACPKDGRCAWSWRLVTPGAGFEDGTGGEAWAPPYRLHLLAMIDALQRVPQETPVTVVTTDQLLVDVCNQYLEGWVRSGLRKQKCQDLLPELFPWVGLLAGERLHSRTGDPHAKDCKKHAKTASSRVELVKAAPGAVQVRSDVEVVAWTDGGSRQNPGPSGWGAVIVHLPSSTTLTLRGGEAHSTNNRMELTAIAEALDAFTRRTAVEVRTDSKFAISVCTEWIRGWKRRGWKRASGDPPVNLDVIQRLDGLLQRHHVVFTWVPGHSGEPGNERADELCNEAIDAVLAGSSPDLRQRDDGPPFPIVR